MKTRSTRRRKALRWTVYGVTTILFITVLVSLGKPFAIYFTYTGHKETRGPWTYGFEIVNARAMYTYSYPEWMNPTNRASTIPSRWDVDWRLSHRKITQASQYWWARPFKRRQRVSPYSGPQSNHTRIDIPLVYPATFFLGWSVWIYFANRHKHRPGHCPKCNYNLAGIETSICPECGHGESP